MSLLLLQGSATHIPLADESVQCVVTSPPYWGLRDYDVSGQLGLELTPALYVENMVEVFREVRRVLRTDGTLWLNLGDSYAGSWGSQGHHQSTTNDQRISRHQIANHPKRAQQTGTIRQDGLKPKDLIGIPWEVALALRRDGWWLRAENIWHKPNPMPESVTDRTTRAHEQVFMLTKAERYFYDADAIREPQKPESEARMDGKFLDRYARVRPPSGYRGAFGGPGGVTYNSTGRNARSVWTIATVPYPGAHFAAFPEALVEPCVLAGSAVGDVVLDPFAGTSTTGRVALRLGRRYVGLDISREYLTEHSLRRTDPIAAARRDLATGASPQGVLEL